MKDSKSLITLFFQQMIKYMKSCRKEVILFISTNVFLKAEIFNVELGPDLMRTYKLRTGRQGNHVKPYVRRFVAATEYLHKYKWTTLSPQKRFLKYYMPCEMLRKVKKKYISIWMGQSFTQMKKLFNQYTKNLILFLLSTWLTIFNITLWNACGVCISKSIDLSC